jgi:hypothetical protein
MMVALLNKIASFHAMWTGQASPGSPARPDTPTTRTASSKRSSQNEFKGIHTDAFFFAGTPNDSLAQPSHPDGSSCGAGCGSSY